MAGACGPVGSHDFIDTSSLFCDVLFYVSLKSLINCILVVEHCVFSGYIICRLATHVVSVISDVNGRYTYMYNILYNVMYIVHIH